MFSELSITLDVHACNGTTACSDVRLHLSLLPVGLALLLGRPACTIARQHAMQHREAPPACTILAIDPAIGCMHHTCNTPHLHGL